jgi:hypothetical protein
VGLEWAGRARLDYSNHGPGEVARQGRVRRAAVGWAAESSQGTSQTLQIVRPIFAPIRGERRLFAQKRNPRRDVGTGLVSRGGGKPAFGGC